MPTNSDPFHIGSLTLQSRVFLGTAMYSSMDQLGQALDASGTELVTVSLRRVKPSAGGADDIYSLLAERNLKLLPNTAGCLTAREAIKTAELARAALGTKLIKLEVIADEETLLPDGAELLEAATHLVRAGFEVLPYTNDDLVLARRLEDAGCVAVMPLAAPIGTGLGIRNPHALSMIRAACKIPVIVDAGLGTASDIALAFELGMDAVLLNTAVARAQDPVLMARSVGLAAEAGRAAFLAGRVPPKTLAESASPLSDRPWRT